MWQPGTTSQGGNEFLEIVSRTSTHGPCPSFSSTLSGLSTDPLRSGRPRGLWFGSMPASLSGVREQGKDQHGGTEQKAVYSLCVCVQGGLCNVDRRRAP